MHLITQYAEKAYATAASRAIKQNLELQEKLLTSYQPYDFFTIKAVLGKAYHNSACLPEEPAADIRKLQAETSLHAIH